MESEADYVLALKRNHRHLSEDVKDAFTGRYTQFVYSTLDKDHGRVEERIYTALRPQEVLNESQYEPWKNWLKGQICSCDGSTLVYRTGVVSYYNGLNKSLLSFPRDSTM